MKKHLEQSLKAAEKKVEQSKQEVADVKKNCVEEVVRAKQVIEAQMNKLLQEAKGALRKEADEYKERLQREHQGEVKKLDKERKMFVVGKMMQRQREHLLRKQFAKQQQKALHINSILAQILEVKSNVEAKANLIDLTDETDNAQAGQQPATNPDLDQEALLGAQKLAQSLLATKTNAAPATPPTTPCKGKGNNKNKNKTSQTASSLSYVSNPRYVPYSKQASKRTGKTTFQETQGQGQGRYLHERHRMQEKSKGFLGTTVART